MTPKRRYYLIGDDFGGWGHGLPASKALWKLLASPVESFHLDGIWWGCLERNPTSHGRYFGKFFIFRNLVGILKMEPHRGLNFRASDFGRFDGIFEG